MCVLCVRAGRAAQPDGEAVRGQSLRADTHAGADASRDAQTTVRGAACSTLSLARS